MPKWIRVKDTRTGHQFDLDARVLPHRRGVEPVNDPQRWPDIEGTHARPRPAKPFVGKDGKAKTPTDATSDGGTADQPQGDVEQTSGRRRTTKTNNTPADAPSDTSKEQQP